MADSQALPVGADQHKGGGRGRSKRRSQSAASARPTGGAQVLTSFCPNPGCSLCWSERDQLTRMGY